MALGSKKGTEQRSWRVSGVLSIPTATNNRCVERFCLNIGWLYTRLVASNSGLDQLNDADTCDSADRGTAPGEGTPLLSKSASAMLHSSIHEFMAMYVFQALCNRCMITTPFRSLQGATSPDQTD